MRMGGGEFARWKALYEVEGFGGRRSDAQTALLATILANTHRAANSKAFTLQDFMPDWWKPHTAVSPKSLAAKFRALVSAAGIEQVSA